MSDKMRLLRQLPSVDEVVEKLKPYDYPHSVVVEAVREVIDDVRYQVICGDHDEIKTEYIIDTVQQLLNRRSLLGIIKVINATGTLLHTNLGRAPLSLKTAEHITNVITGYCSLEHNLLTGKRGERGIGVEQLIKSLTGAESAVIVNNNAAAVLLTLKALAIGREVVISRGELVEIGGSFRIPEVMEQSGALLHEIGTTNMTRLSDYEKAINDNTAALMKVHTSNYKIVGFTESVSSKELAQLAHDRGLIFIDDLGSGSMINLSDYGLPKEPIVRESIAGGADVVTFSGDKLLGGPQAGIIIGKSDYIKRIKRHPLMRALRVDKMTLASLEYTLSLYLEPEKALKEIPVLKGLSASEDDIKQKAQQLYQAVVAKIKQPGCIKLVKQKSIVGGGSLPLAELPTWCLQLNPCNVSCEKMAANLRERPIPVIPRIVDDKLLFDLRTVDESELIELAPAIIDEINR